jgi:hypothetical protein
LDFTSQVKQFEKTTADKFKSISIKYYGLGKEKINNIYEIYISQNKL